MYRLLHRSHTIPARRYQPEGAIYRFGTLAAPRHILQQGPDRPDMPQDDWRTLLWRWQHESHSPLEPAWPLGLLRRRKRRVASSSRPNERRHRCHRRSRTGGFRMGIGLQRRRPPTSARPPHLARLGRLLRRFGHARALTHRALPLHNAEMDLDHRRPTRGCRSAHARRRRGNADLSKRAADLSFRAAV